MKSLNATELASLIAVARKHSPQDALMLTVCFSHALRVSELLSLTRENIVDSHLVIQRSKGSRKTIQPLLPDERDGLLELAKNDGRFFDICRKTVWSRIQKYGAEAGIPEFLCHPHVLRHSACKLGLAGGMTIPQVQKYAGHVSGASTLIYLEEDEQTSASAFAAAMAGAR